jgi:hypothetical protein
MKSVFTLRFLLLVVAASAALTTVYLFTQKPAVASPERLKSEEDFKQIAAETSFLKKRTAFLSLTGVFSRENDKEVLFKVGDNAVDLQDPEGLEAIIKTVESLSLTAPEDRRRLETLKATAAEFLAVRVRKDRFKADNTAEQIKTLDSELQNTPDNQEKILLRNNLIRIEDVLSEKFPGDAGRAIRLDPNNPKAYYDLARFFQDRRIGDDNKLAAENFEQVIRILEGRMEKDADYLRANLNLSLLYYSLGNIEKSKCYAAKTIEKYRAKSREDDEYLFGVDEEGNLNEPEFIDLLNKINPRHETSHGDCKK